jgi:hypothetical protein
MNLWPQEFSMDNAKTKGRDSQAYFVYIEESQPEG